MLRLSLLVFLMGARLACAQEITPEVHIAKQLQDGDIYLDAGGRPILKQMGYGWGDNGHQKGWSGRWITHHEADLVFDVSDLNAFDFTLRAAPAIKMDKLQSIALFLNGRFIEKWVCPYDPDPKLYKGKIGVEDLKLGENKLTLRIGYITVAGGDDVRRLGLQVDYIHLRPDA